MLGLKRGTVELLPHNPLWIKKAKETITELKGVLGDSAVDIQHVGSTSVPSIKAKPIIDIVVGVKSLDCILKFKSHLSKKGYVHREKNDNEHQRFFIKENPIKNIVTHHIYMVIFESRQWQDYIGFRNYLINDTEAALVYEGVKCELAKEYEGNRDLYTKCKNPFISTALRKAQVYYFFGKTVSVAIDRPIGSIHPKRGFAYPINYGYIEGVIAPDGEELDVYVLDVNEPCDVIDARVTAIINRNDDVEDKLVAAPKGVIYNQAKIAELTHFQEKYYSTKVTSMKQKSCGAVIYRKNNNNVEFLLLFQRNSQTWSFPKGHIEAFEMDKQAALREIQEETGLTVSLLDEFKESLFYPISDLIQKEVVLFLATSNQKVNISKDEIEKYAWVDKKTALSMLMHEDYEKILAKANDYILRGCFDN